MFSDYNTITRNNILNNMYGIHIEADDNNVFGNLIAANNNTGVWIVALSDHNSITGNTITNNNKGIDIEGSYSNSIVGNNITNNNCGIDFRGSYSYGNIVCANNLTNNSYGVYSWGWASNNLIYHNNFVNNTHPAYNSESSRNVWDNGYPAGGNYWSDYAGADMNNGPNQNLTGSDGIGDTQYVIDINNQDNYPLIHPYGSIRNLNTSLTYLTIQSAINAPETLNGHTIFVETGTYYENVVVNKTVTLLGENKDKAIIDGSKLSPWSKLVEITADNVSIIGFTIRNGPYPCGGIRIVSDNNAVSNNILVNNSWGGIDIVFGCDNRIGNNLIINNVGFGVGLYCSNSNLINDNTIADHFHCFYLTNSSGNTFYHNNIYSTHVFTDEVSKNIWDDGYPSGGNYWSDYEERYPNATELDDSGIWDTPFVIDEQNQDRYPLMKPYAPLLGDFDEDRDIDEDDLWYFCAYFITYHRYGFIDEMKPFDFNNDSKIDEDDMWMFCSAFIDYWKRH